jgi:phosphoribosylglycinamide formyltransferase 1
VRIAVLLSGGGRSLENLVQKTRAREIESEVVLAIATSRKVPGLERARRLGVPAFALEFQGARLAHHVFQAMDSARIDLACLAGWTKLLAPIPEHWKGRVLNIHPALLPAFGGKGMWGDHVHEAVLASGKSVTGCTVHFCDDEYDHGPIVVQRTCPVLPGDTVATLALRVFEEEKKAYPEAIRIIERDHPKVSGRRLDVLPG